jgi:hypothetical protein
VVLNTDEDDLETCVNQILDALEAKGII